MIYLDNAATTAPKPPSVITAVENAMRRYNANPGRSGHAASVTAAQKIYSVRSRIAAFFGLSQEENVVFTANCTAALNTVIRGVLQKGDHVILSSLEHNAVLRPLESLSRQGIISYSVAPVGDTAEETIDAFRNALNSRTRMIICTHASNVFGTVLPVRRLCALAHSYGVLFCLDAAQSAGVLPIHMGEDGFDYVCCPGHKGLYGPMGTGLLLIGCDTIPRPLTEGGTGSASADSVMPDYLPDRLESGTLNVPGILGLAAGVDFVSRKGIADILNHETSLIRYLYEGLGGIKGLRLYTPLSKGAVTAPLLSFTVDGKDSESSADFLNSRYGIAVRSGLHCAPLAHRSMGTIAGGTVRVSPSVFTKRQEIQIFINAVNKFVQLS